MKVFILIFLFGAQIAWAQSSPSIWGQIVKTKKETRGYEYFVYFKEGGKDYAYPLSSDSKMGKERLEEMVGKYAKIYGKAEFEKAKLGEASYIMAFKVNRIDPLTLKDLNENISLYGDRLEAERFVPRPPERKSETFTMAIDDKTANSAIMVGGAALAAEVLANILGGN